MFFLIISVIFIIQVFLLTVCIFGLLNFNVRILLLSDAIESYNSWLSTRAGSIEGIFSDLKLLTRQLQDRIKQRRKKFIFGQIIGIMEWLLILLIKNKHKKFLFGYKVAKTLSSRLSMLKNMV